MFLCKVTGSVVATRQREIFRPCNLLVVRQVDQDGEVRPETQEMLALDAQFGAGVGDIVLVAREGQAAAHVLNARAVPANVVILGVVDDWDYDDSD